MSLTSALYIAGTGLSAVSRYTDLVSQNIANAQTEGYSRRDLVVGEQVLGGKGAGVDGGVVARASASYLDQTLYLNSARLGRQSVIAETLEYLGAEIGDLTSSDNLSSHVDDMLEKMRDLAESPESTALQRATIRSAQSVATDLNTLSATVQNLRTSVDQQISDEVEGVNSALDKLHAVSQEIQLRKGSGQDVSALLDQQDKLLSQISSSLPIKATTKSDGSLYVYTAEGGNVLYDHGPRYLAFASYPAMSPSVVYSSDPSSLASPYVGALSGLYVESSTGDVDITPSSGLDTAVSTGKLAGLLELRDTILPEAQKQLDTIAAGLIQTFRDADATVSGDDSLFTADSEGIDFTVSGNEVGIAQQIKVNVAFDPDNGGQTWRLRDGVNASAEGNASDDTQLRDFIDALTADQTFSSSSGLSSTQSIISAAKDFITRQVTGVDNAQVDLESETTRYNTISDARNNITGVNVDDETQKMIMLSQLYSANATMIKSIQEMFDELLNAVN